MFNYIDYEWKAGRKYRLFSFRRLIADLYNLKVGGVYPLQLNIEGLKLIREINVGAYIVEFDSLRSYVNAFRTMQERNATIVREEDYDKFFKQYLTVVERPANEDAKIYAEPANGCQYVARLGHILEIDIFYASGFYTTALMNVSEFSTTEQKDVYKLRDIWLERQDEKFDYCKEQTETIDGIIKHLTDIHNTAGGQLAMFKEVIETNKKKGFGMCAYKIHYYDTDLTTKAFAKKPEDLFRGLLEDYKDKVSGVDTIAFCLDDMEVGRFYKVVFTNNTEFEFLFKGMEDFSKLIARHIKVERPFRVEKL